MRYSLVLLPLLLGLTACTVETPAPTTTYTYVPAAPSTATVVRTPY